MSKISVVMCTYNGSRYVEHQLDTIKNQTVKPDEVLIYDDASSDDTADVIRRYMEDTDDTTASRTEDSIDITVNGTEDQADIAVNGTEDQADIAGNHTADAVNNWKLYVNSPNKGWKRNFGEALYSASGDYIFLSDQDDDWNLTKLEKMSECLDQHSEIDLLMCNYEMVFDKGAFLSSLAYRFTASRYSSKEKLIRIPTDEKWVYTGRPGCTYCVRKSFLEELRNYWDFDLPHDGQLWQYAVLKGSAYIYNEKLINFQRHTTSTTTTKKMTMDIRLGELKEMKTIYINAENYCQDLGADKQLGMLQHGMGWLESREEAVRSGKLIRNISTYNRYRKYYLSSAAVLIDYKAGR